jgi:hypothetical protein
MNDGRDCVQTRGCAYADECIDSTTNEIYDGTTYLVNSQNPAGMKIKPKCCLADSFADDDVLAIDYANVCNSAGLSFSYSSVLTGVCVTAVAAVVSML